MDLNESEADLQEPLLDEASQRTERKSRNVPLTLMYMFLRCAGEAVWYGSVFSAYVYIIHPENPAIVGYLSAFEGLTQFVAASIAGVIADIYRRDTLLKVSCIVGLLASFLTFLSSVQESRGPYWWCLICAMPLWGAFDGIGLTASMALFADSIPDGKRSYFFTQRTVLTGIGSFVGPICALSMFAVFGNTWTVSACSKVICVAQVALLPAFALLCFFRDEDTPIHSVPESEEDRANQDDEGALEEEPKFGGEEGRDNQGDADAGSQAPMTAANRDPENAEPNFEDPVALDNPEEVTVASNIEDPRNETIFRFGMTKPRFIALNCATSDVVCALAAGMSFRYFAVFFLDNLILSPVFVQILDAISCLTGSALLVVAQRIAVLKGRCSVSIAFKVSGVFFLIMMVVLYTTHQKSWIVCTFYILQNSFLNSTQALTRSLVMDNVPANERAKWSALESINIFGWCGSAAIGGLLVHIFHGVIPVFLLSATLQVLGCLPLVALIGVENLEES